MLKPEQVPPDAMYAAWKAINAGMTLNDAIAAAINAWPGVGIFEDETGWDVHIELPLLILLNTEPRDDAV